MSSDSAECYCPSHGLMVCPICGHVLAVVKYSGGKRDLLALAQSRGFRCFLGCLRVDLHDKVLDGVNYRGKVYIQSVFAGSDVESR